MTDNTMYLSRRDRRRASRKSLASAHAASAGRATAAVLAASGLVISSGVAANAAENSDEVRESATILLNSSELTVERSSSTAAVTVAASSDVDLSFDRPTVTSEPAPEPEPEPTPAIEATPVAQQTEQPAPQSEPAESQQSQQQSQPAPQSQQQSEPTQQESQQSSSGSEGEGSPAGEQEEQPASSGNNSVVSAAYAGIGAPYLWGGTTPSGFDCSGFINWAYNQAGRGGLPRTTYGMDASLPRVSSPQPGDIVLANNNTHGAIYVGNGQVISSTPSGGVRLHGMNERWHQVNAIVRPG